MHKPGRPEIWYAPAREAARSYSRIAPIADFAENECGSLGALSGRNAPRRYRSPTTSSYNTRAARFVQKMRFALLVARFVSENWRPSEIWGATAAHD